MSLSLHSIAVRGIGYGAQSMAMLGFMDLAIAPLPAPARSGRGYLSGLHFHQTRPDRARRPRKRRDADLLLMRPL